MDYNHEDNPFDRLPDALLLLIFEKILELEPKTLVSCFLVSKRTSLLSSYTNTNTVFLPMEAPATPQSKKTSRRSFKNRFTYILSKISRKPKPRVSISSSSWDQVLQKEVRASSIFLKWKAFFGTELRDSLFLFAEFFRKINDPLENITF